jgi:nucleoid-associated protein YgaU
VKPPGHYVVQSGDTLWDIADMHYDDGTQYAVLEEANRKLGDPDLIRPCQRIFVPAAK